MKRFNILLLSTLISVIGAACAVCPAQAATDPRTAPGEGADLCISGVGTGNGQFDRLRDITFGTDGRLYTLETAGSDSTTAGNIVGLGRVQVFDNSGKFLNSFSLGADAQAANAVTAQNQDGPMAAARIAVDGQNRVYVSFPIAGLVRVFGTDGRKLNDISFVGALALACANDGKIIALGSHALIRGGHWVWDGGGAFAVLTPSGIQSTTPLSQPLWNVLDATVASNGDLLVLAGSAAAQYNWNPTPVIWRYNSSGTLLSSLGSGHNVRAQDGSEPLHSLVIGRDGAITTMTYGNPGPIVRFAADGKTVVRRAGRFSGLDVWCPSSAYTPLALDPSGRLWVGIAYANNPKDLQVNTRHQRPAVLRTQTNFFDSSLLGVAVSDVRTLGFTPKLSSPLPFNIAYEAGKPIQTVVTVPAARRALDWLQASFRVFDVNGRVIASGEKSLSLVNDQPSQATFEWTPPTYGPYTVVVDYNSSADVLKSQVLYYGVTPRYASRPEMRAGDSVGGWEDPVRQKFCGLDLMRLHLAKGDAKLLADLDAAKKNGVIAFVQMTDKVADFTPENATRLAKLVKGRGAIVELCNEPNLIMSVADYATRAKAAYNAIKAVDPQIQVVGPAICGINLGFIEGYYQAGGKATCDILSVHDYEGHESITAEHWKWKYGALRALMAKYGDAQKPVWQTERAISSVRGGLNTGLSQAIRLTLHRDLLSSLGVPDNHNSHYYLNQGGYSDVPSYVWCDLGPLPGALAVRTRAALIGERPWQSSLDFGAVSNSLYEGECYRDATGSTLSLRNLIGGVRPLDFAVTPGTALSLFDAWGNPLDIPVKDGVLTLPLGQLPLYVQITGAGTLAPKTWKWGQNVALGAKVSVQGTSVGDLSLLTNGILESIHEGDPLGGTDGKNIVELSGFSPRNPAIVALQLKTPASINRVIVHGLSADNAFGALRDFDLEVHTGGVWKRVARGGTAIPPTVLGESGDAGALTFYANDNAWAMGFDPVVADGIRLVIRDATRGFEPDEVGRAQVVKTWGGANPLCASLREIEAYLAN